MTKTLSLKESFIRRSNASRLFSCPVPLVGLTGGIASGKSTVSNLLRAKGIPLLCADNLVKLVYQEEATLEFLQRHFPDTLTPEAPFINFKLLRELVFSDPDKRKMVEDFIYPQLPRVFQSEFSKLLSQSKSQSQSQPRPINFLVYDVPLLFERSLEEKFDVVLCIYANEEIQIQRLMSRDHITLEMARKMLAAQLPMDVKKEKSDLVIENEGTLEDLERKVDETLVRLLCQD